MLQDYEGCTFIFEYISKKDAHVVKYSKEQEGLYLIGIRNVDNGFEWKYDSVLKMAQCYDIPTTKLFDKTLDQIMNELDDKSSDEAEGFVINIDGYKVKVKYNDYVHIHKALSKLSSINLIIRSIADDTYDDLLSKLPVAYHERVKKVARVVYKYIQDTEVTIRDYYSLLPVNKGRKEFMIAVDEMIPKKYRNYCRSIYLRKPYNVLKTHENGAPKYKKLNQMGVGNYNEIFD